MGVITKIEEQKNKNRVNIYIDDSFFCGIEKESAIICGLKLGKFFSEEEIETAILKSEEKRAFEKSMSYLNIRLHSKKELCDKLKKKNFSDTVIESTIKKLEEYRYINDEFYAKEFIEQNSKLSKIIILNKLFQKGIDKEIIDKNLSEIDDDLEYEKCKIVASKLLKNSIIQSNLDKQKFMAKLVRRGFNFEIAKKVLENLNLFEDEF